jgi:hypothetical protein
MDCCIIVAAYFSNQKGPVIKSQICILFLTLIIVSTLSVGGRRTEERGRGEVYGGKGEAGRSDRCIEGEADGLGRGTH